MNVYCALKVLSDLKGSKRDKKRPKMMRALEESVLKKRGQSFKKLVSWFFPRTKVNQRQHWIFNCSLWTGAKQRPDLWKNHSWIPHKDNVSALSVLSVKAFLTKYSIPVLNHPSYLTSVAPFDFYFQKSNWIWRAQDLRAWNRSKQKRRRLSISWQKRISGTALYSAKFGRSGPAIEGVKIFDVIYDE